MIFQNIILQGVEQLKSERSSAAIYHILRGKRSIQTVQDAHIYKLTQYYGIIPKLEQSFFDSYVEELVKKNSLQSFGKQQFQITNEGKYQLSQNKVNKVGFKGLKYHQIDEIFMNRLLLFIQMITNAKMNHFSYIPIIDERSYTIWARNIYHRLKNHLDETLEQLYLEIKQVCQKISTKEANIFIDRLTGYHRYGQSIHQLSVNYGHEPIDIQLLLTKVIHIILTSIFNNQKKFPLLNNIAPNLSKQTSFLTNSAQKTYKLFKQGYEITQIASIRNLRESTIFDHLVEISLYDEQFPFHQFLTKEIIDEVFDVLQENLTFKLKDIKQNVSPDVSYFEIRLALSKYTQLKGDLS
ncbi:MAG TPA: helix-turn-helix domain-containing protein [Bacillota bacterium]|nr:helix-turn-helix domain-containing protein [Bacillota bacterium]